MTRPKKKRINKDRVREQHNIKPKTRKLVECKCILHCNGSKLVDPRTLKKHQKEVDRFRVYEPHQDDEGSPNSIRERTISPVEQNRSPSNDSTNEVIQTDQELEQNRSPSNDSTDGVIQTDQEPVNLPKKRKRRNKFRSAVPDEQEPVLSEEDFEEDFEVPDDGDGSSIEDEEDDRGLSEDDVPVEQFTAPDFDDLDFESDHEYSNTNSDRDDSWILLWIFKYQARFRLPDVAIDSLIKFFKMVLLDADQSRFETFPTSSYVAKKLLGIGKQERTYAVCPKCNTLYKVAEILPQNVTDRSNSGFKCTHVEFPNHPRRGLREPCGTELTRRVPVGNGYMRKPKMVFPIPSLKIQLITMYQRPGFESLLSKWTNRNVDTGMMSDIYDGEIWKNFPSRADTPDSSRFFTPETADSNLGIMINLDWFQPFESSAYSSGVLYGVICNLPREVRFKRENILTLGLLPGPNEVKLHKINHYLSPIVDELLEFWSGFLLPSTSEHPEGKRIRLAVICCSNDIPAARKLCGHISALAACHRCYKRANIDGRKMNFGGFDDMADWFRARDLDEHRTNAEGWRHCKTNDERKQHVSTTLVRWSEMLRLPYFNPIRHLVVDPMHCLFLGIAHWIVKRLWVDGGKITQQHLELLEKRAKDIKIPADLGRIPNKIATGEGFSGFTADQWKTFILIYAIPLMWDLLGTPDRRILSNFVRACSLLVCRTIDNNALNEAHNRLLFVARLIEDTYGPEVITPNIHLSLHLVECCRDYGPLYSFWCYSFERMNGLLGKLLYRLLSKK
jgi:hypothetical protein